MLNVFLLFFAFIFTSSCRRTDIKGLIGEGAKAEQSNQVEAEENNEVLSADAMTHEEGTASEPVSIAGAYLTCVGRNRDANISYGCTFVNARKQKLSLEESDVERIDIFSGSEILKLPILWHEANDTIHFSFEDMMGREKVISVKVTMKDPNIKIDSKISVNPSAPSLRLIWSDSFEKVDLSTAAKNNNDVSWYLESLEGWQITWAPPQSGLAPCSSAPAVEIQKESAGGVIAQDQPKPFQGTYDLELDSGCIASPLGNIENNAVIRRSQTVKTGHWYSIQFAYRSRPGSTAPRFIFTRDLVTVLDESGDLLPSQDWRVYTHVFKALSPAFSMSFADYGASTDTARGILLDDVRMSEIE